MSKVQTLPPTDQISDPQVRAFCEALANAWNLRNGNIDAGEEERFVTKGELTDETLNVLSSALSAGTVPGGPPGPPSGSSTRPPFVPNAAAEALDRILRTRIQLIAIPLVADILRRVANAEAGMLNVKDVQATRDLALASAVNTIWAAVGSNQSLIQDGVLAGATPVGTTAVHWTQVQSAITDPNNPGTYISSAAIREDFQTYAISTSGALSATWTIRVNAANQIAGIGLGIVAPGGSQPVVSSFNVIADQFIVSNQDTPALAVAPFQIDTNTGVVYMNAAVIKDGDIGNAKIGNLIYSDNYFTSNGQNGWLINKDGTAYFQNVFIGGNSVIGGTATVGRLNVTGVTTGSVFVPNNDVGVVPHNSGRPVVVTVWSPNGNASLAGMDDSSFSVRVDFAGDATAYYSYF